MTVPHVLRRFTFLGWTLQAALDLPAANEARTRQVAELWCGVGSIWRYAAAMGYEAIGYDKARLPGVTDSEGPLCEDITMPSGFKNAILVVLSLVPGGLLWQGIDCSTMGWVNTNNTCRTKSNPHGNLRYRPVRVGNAQATAAAFLYALACLRSVLCVTENPCNTFLFKLNPWKLVASVYSLTFALACRCAFDTAPYGKRFLKRYRLAGGPWVTALARKCECPCRKHKKTTYSYWKNGKKKITGLKCLKKTGAYPPAFGKWVIRKWAQAKSVPKHQADTSIKKTQCWILKGEDTSIKQSLRQPSITIKQPQLQQPQVAIAQPQLTIQQPRLLSSGLCSCRLSSCSSQVAIAKPQIVQPQLKGTQL